MIELFNKYPLLRLILPIIMGIIFSHSDINILYIMPIMFFIGIFFILKKYSYINEIIFGLLFFSLSFFNSEINLPYKNAREFDGKIFLRVDDCFHNDFNTKLNGKIINSDAFNSNRILILLEGNDYDILPGTVLSFYPELKEIKNLGNPYEFDYCGYLNNKGIFHEQYLKRNEYIIVGEAPTIFNYSTRLKNVLVNNIFKLNISNESQEFLIAILLGDKRFLDSDLKQKFSNIGIAHILALSGLHVGIIGFLIYVFLFPLDYLVKRNCRLFITVLLLICYAFITGCSPSVIRALFMFILISVSILVYRKNNIINSLIASAIVILLISPVQLYDVGFQLSYIAVLSIVLFVPILNPFRQNKFLYRASNYILVSVAAMLGTGLLSAYYFNIAPILFIIPNILIVPLLPLLLLNGLIILSGDYNIFNFSFELLYNLIISISNLINDLSFSSLRINLNSTQLMISYVFIISLFFLIKYYKNLRIRYIMPCVLIICVLGCVLFAEKSKPFKMIIFNDFAETPILINRNSSMNFLPLIDDRYLELFNKYNKKFLSIYSIDEIGKEKDLRSALNDGSYYFVVNGKRFIVLDSTQPRICHKLKDRLNIDYIVLTKNCHTPTKKILMIYNPKKIIISGNIYDLRRNEIINTCLNLNIEYYDIKNNGAFIVD